jgi:hypothetical protein
VPILSPFASFGVRDIVALIRPSPSTRTFTPSWRRSSPVSLNLCGGGSCAVVEEVELPVVLFVELGIWLLAIKVGLLELPEYVTAPGTPLEALLHMIF